MKTVLTVQGTRPEVIKLAPVIKELEQQPGRFRTINVTSGQHTDLLYPFICQFQIRIDHDLRVMTDGQTPSDICARVLASLDPILVQAKPDLLLVQGDTTTALASALAGFHRRIPVGHVEAGLRSGNPHSPYPEEMNRQLITRLATYHFAATSHNRKTLLSEGVAEQRVFVTGNPVVDSLQAILKRGLRTSVIEQLLNRTRTMKRIVLTTHRRESFGDRIAENLKTLRSFVELHPDVALIFPVHPNPEVGGPANAILQGHSRIHLIEPLGYEDFIVLLTHAWLIVSDSGGVQEEAPSLRKPLLILRENTERPEAVESGFARLVGGCPEGLRSMLEEAYRNGHGGQALDALENPFGRGDSGRRIVDIIDRILQ